ncbi:DUF1653 domain-containing protein [candidate division WWE3 bacterium]|uniref:DUF1653 domain-containing protein n=1 Tax=candidate division WWE3 bacterium TaxID=2053526 RepID=A0A955LKW5_UNCKA|nr:DUF1653 domain-containing protein [candidate division WWE3 bacterium]
MGHKTYPELLSEVKEAEDLVKVGGQYTHYKHPDKPYDVLFVGITEWDENPVVIYRSRTRGEDVVWVRRLTGEDGWLTPATDQDGNQVDRFVPYQE